MNSLDRVVMNDGSESITGVVAARRPKTDQIYVMVDGESHRLDNWYSAASWSVMEGD